MANLNKVMLIGNLTRDPELRATQGGTSICKLGLAMNRKIPGKEGGDGKEEVTYVDLTAWGKVAELIAKFLKKGDPLFVEGRLTLEKWTDKESNKERTKVSVTVENMQFLGGKKAEKKREEPEGEPDYGEIPF